MTQKTKHRMVSITFIIALVVLITPFIYKKNNYSLEEMEHRSFSSKSVPNDMHEGNIISLSERFATSEDSTRQQNPSSEPAMRHSHSKRVLDDNRSTTWIIQLASFANDNNASKLVELLRKQGYNAYTQNIVINTNELALTRVLVGPQARRIYAEDLVSQLANEFGLEGMIVKNNPLDN